MQLDIINKINNVLYADTLTESVEPNLTEIMRLASSHSRFDSQAQFKQFLTEGALLNVNILASQNIGIPAGQYLVYSVDPTHTILVPTSSIVQETELYNKPVSLDVFTQDLFKAWNKFEMLTEAGPPQIPQGEPGPPGEPEGLENWEQNLNKPSGKKEQIQTADVRSKWPRDKQAKGAAEASGKTQKEIAAAASKIAGEEISEPDVSRALAASGTPSSRMPELHRASAIAAAMGSTIEQVFGTKITKGTHK